MISNKELRERLNTSEKKTKHVHRWHVILNNEQIYQEDPNDIGCWKSLKKHCDKNNLKIKEMYFNNELVDKNASGYFIFYEAIGY